MELLHSQGLYLPSQPRTTTRCRDPNKSREEFLAAGAKLQLIQQKGLAAEHTRVGTALEIQS